MTRQGTKNTTPRETSLLSKSNLCNKNVEMTRNIKTKGGPWLLLIGGVVEKQDQTLYLACRVLIRSDVRPWRPDQMNITPVSRPWPRKAFNLVAPLPTYIG